MTALWRLAGLSLVLAFGQIVFGAIVRVTGSGMGCGDHWPQCAGYWIPPLERPDLIIEVTHRYIALALTLSIVALIAVAFVRRRLAGVGGPGGVLRAAALAGVLVVTAALFGAATVKYELENKGVIVTHLAIAMTLLAVLLVVIDRTRRGAVAPGVRDGTRRSAYVAAGLAFVTIVLGALTAHIPGANLACGGFPLCNGAWVPSVPLQHVQYTHRVLALLLLLHTLGLTIGVLRRREGPVATLAAAALGAILLQIAVAAWLVEAQLPPLARSLHEAVGTLIWVLLVALAIAARRHSPATAPVPAGAVRRAEARA
jgi:heme A synthase